MDSEVQDDDDKQTIIIEEKITRANGEQVIKSYQRGKYLGKGGFAKCYEVTNLETKKIYAAKIVAKSNLTRNRQRQKLISEIKIHKSLQQQNIVQFEHVFEHHENVYILLELCSNQTLRELMKKRKRLSELEIQCYVAQIVSALKYLVSCQVIHRDLKLGNLFLNKNLELKLGDFGLATKLEFEGEKKRTICGTPNYIAPEVLDGKSGHSFEVDVWSLGVIIYAMLFGQPPFETLDMKTTYNKIKQNKYSFPEQVPSSEAAKNLITKILNLEPTRRPSLDEIMAHPFMSNGGMIPKVVPLSMPAVPPTANYIRQLINQNNNMLNGVKSQDRFPMQKPDSSGNLMEDQFALSNLNNAQSTGYVGTNRPQFSNPIDTKNSQNQNILNGPSCLQGADSVNNLIHQQTGSRTQICVKKWVDYTSKYGLGYLLSNGATGVFFNDSTKIVLDPCRLFYYYIERKGTEIEDLIQQYNLNEYPREIQKKVTILEYFKGYFESQANSAAEYINPQYQNTNLYIKKWMKTRHAIIFRLSNKTVQVIFTDKTEIILSTEEKMVTYVNKLGERSNYPLATALDSQNTEMAKRLKYTKEILTNMFHTGNQQQNKQIIGVN